MEAKTYSVIDISQLETIIYKLAKSIALNPSEKDVVDSILEGK